MSVGERMDKSGSHLIQSVLDDAPIDAVAAPHFCTVLPLHLHLGSAVLCSLAGPFPTVPMTGDSIVVYPSNEDGTLRECAVAHRTIGIHWTVLFLDVEFKRIETLFDARRLLGEFLSHDWQPLWVSQELGEEFDVERDDVNELNEIYLNTLFSRAIDSVCGHVAAR